MDLFPASHPEDDETTIRELATRMDVSPLKLLAVATAYGIPVVWIEHKINAEQAEKLRGVWVISGGELPAAEPKENFPGLRPRQLDPEHDPVIAAIEDSLNVPWHKRHDRRRPPQKPKPVALPPLTGTAAAAQRQWPSISHDAAKAIATQWTARCGFTDTQATEWWRHGLRDDEAQLALVLAELGGRPEHLDARFRTETLLDKLRDGLAPEHAIDLLRRHNLLGEAS